MVENLMKKNIPFSIVVKIQDWKTPFKLVKIENLQLINPIYLVKLMVALPISFA